MQRNLLKGIIFISAIALSSCSTMNKLSKEDNIGDDVYNTKAKAGDQLEYFAPVTYTQPQNNYVRNDDYYYYGDYESRINRFAYLSPFDYDDDFYYSYAPNDGYYNQPAVAANVSPVDDGYYYDPAYDFGVYDAFDFGFGYYGGYDNYGYGNAYSSFIYSGSTRRGRGGRSYSHSNNAGGGGVSGGGLVFTKANGRGNGFGGRTSVTYGNGGNQGLAFTRANTIGAGSNTASNFGARPGGSNAVYPGRPGTNSVAPVNGTVNNNNATRYIRPQSENPRQVVSQPVMERPSSPPPSSSSSSSGGGGGGNTSGGGGRPVRP